MLPQPVSSVHHAPSRRRVRARLGLLLAAVLVFLAATTIWRPRNRNHPPPQVEDKDLDFQVTPALQAEDQQVKGERGVVKVPRRRNTLADRSFVEHIDEPDHFLATPSILELPSGRLLVLFEKQESWGKVDPLTKLKLLYASDDGGKSWQQVGLLGPLQWPQIFSCNSGVYILGCQRAFSANNNIVITRMEPGSEGKKWTPPTQLTTGLSVVTINSGVDVSSGRVTKAFEVIPSMARPRKASRVTKAVTVPVASLKDVRPSWHLPPTIEVPVQDATGFITYTLVKVPTGDTALFFRVAGVDTDKNVLRLRLERFTLFWENKDIHIARGAVVEVGSGSNVYGGVDWVSMAMSANSTSDLTDPAAWVWSNPLGNPASMHSNEVRTLFDAAFRADYLVRKSIIGFNVPALEHIAPDIAYHAGFGSLYWMEGVVFRLQDKRGGNGLVLNILRVNNDLFCDLAALVLLDDSVPGAITAKFLRYKNVPGLAVGHPAILYDSVSDLYWMASNVNRDSGRNWKQPWEPSTEGPKLHITPFSTCEVDRSTIGLYYSGNGMDWHSAGIVDYHLGFGQHFTYPHMTISGDDLLIVMRATAESGKLKETAQYYNNHNSNAISFHRVFEFRSYANVEWATYTGPYTRPGPRLISSES